MRKPDIRIVPAAAVRRALTAAGDVRTEIAFQNDINVLLAQFDEVQTPWRPIAGPVPTFPAAIVSDITPMPAAPRARPAPARPMHAPTPTPRLRVVQGRAVARPPQAGGAVRSPQAAVAPAAPQLTLSTDQVTLPTASKARAGSPLRRA